MKTSIRAAKINLSKLILRAQAGEEVIIFRASVPVARLVPIVRPSVPKCQAGTLKGRIKIHPSFFDPMPEEELALWECKGE